MTETYIYKNTVHPDWIDHNQHLHDAKYYDLFSDSVVDFFKSVGLSTDYRNDLNITTFSLEAHISFLKELLVHEKFYIKAHIYDYDYKRVHLFLTMYNDEDERCATYEVIMMGVDFQTRKSTPFPDEVFDKIANYFEQQPNFDSPKQLGHVIGIPKR
ncbi:thioesterase family protein [Staphylococcus gallinarum]|uniref:thioesterase family protein n=1 Tax=Staphylococcus gallinarum TaxID=1293 RepID=UPI000D1E290F|nr:thioesterase family protein [Staphylococcus gallinarum]MCD8821889.1 thioesterase family protein [Staphylococcus gallinarum]MCQ9288490.1 thioesterase family protein [Staphylococcus gallinarum]MEB6242928.1 thioesterase family protein [Staphylococcus gallinarum]MEB6297032.1 thioesterase family protein [Staphylococcus gallinarum]PTL09465.1 thioesterase [Staphylococcus gallinarum]